VKCQRSDPNFESSPEKESSAMPGEFLNCRSDLRFVGDPIDVVTGANTDIITDLAQRGPLPFRWTRYYNSARSKMPCSLGWGHSHGFDCLLFRDLDGLHYQDPSGSVVGFLEPTYTPTHAAGMALSRRPRDRYVISRPKSPDQVFQFTPGSDVAHLTRLRRGRFTIEFRHSEGGVLREIVDSRHRVIRVTPDPAGRILNLNLVDEKTGKQGALLLAYEYDRAGNLICATDLYKTTLTFAYGEGNRMTRRTDRRGYSFHFEYDDEGRCIHSRGDDGLLEVFLEYDSAPKTTIVTRGDGGRWIYAFNDQKTITQITDPYGNATKFTLDVFGRPAEEIDPNGNITQLHYDSLGRHDYRIDPNGHVLPTKAENPEPADPLAYQLPKTPLEWDLGLLVAKETIETPEVNDPVLSHFPAPIVNTVLGQTTTYDPSANQTTTHGPETLLQNDFGQFLEISTPSFTERWKYDANGNLIEHQDRDGSVYRYVYKSWNARGQSIDPLGNVTSFDFNEQGLVSKVTDPGGTVTDFRYDLRDLLVEVHRNGQLRETYHRDRAGNVVQKGDNLGRTLMTWEVGLGNLDKADILSSGEKRPFERDGSGRIIKAQTPAGTATFAYDDDGNLVADKRDGTGICHQIESGQLRSTSYFDKFKVRYDRLGNGDWIIQDPTGARHRFEVGKTGLVVKHLGNGAKELCQFDRDGRCRRKAVMHNHKDSTLWMRGYAYSATGDLLTVADTKRGTTRYRHDPAHRLIEEIPPAGPARRFRHDAAGNLLEQPGLKDVVIEDANRLKEASGERFSYNKRGDLSERQGSKGTTRYEYDALDMLVRCHVSGEPWTATYDGLCRRVQKTWRAETTTYYWDDFRLSAEVRQDGSCRLYIYADDVALSPFLFVEYASVDAEPALGKRYYVFTNQVGAPLRVEDDTGKVCWSAQIDPYGIAHLDANSTIEMPLRFPGHYFDQETGLHYNRFRYFSPELGRYIQSDPVGLFGGTNVYAYLTEPLSHVDIDGLGRKGSGGGNARKPKTEGKPSQLLPPGCAFLKIEGADKMSPEQLKAELDKRAQAMLEKLKKGDVVIPGKPPYVLTQKHAEPCLAVVVDKNGNVFYGQNTNKFPDKMDPRLASNAAAQASKEPLRTDVGAVRSGATQLPGTHAEVHATDRALKNDPSQSPSDVTVHNVSPSGKEMPCCPNCTGTLNADGKGPGPGVKPTTPPRDRDEFVDPGDDYSKKEPAEFRNPGKI
jgi:RHS repeat-associated protein